MTDELHIHVIMKNGNVLDFTMHKNEVAQFMEELAQDGYDGEQIDSVRIGDVSEEVFSENKRGRRVGISSIRLRGLAGG